MPPSDQPAPLPPPHPNNYDFIMNPAPPPKKSLLAGADSTIKRIGLIVGCILLLVILLVVVKNLVAGKPKLDSMVTVAQDQQELIHLAANAAQQDNLSTANKNLVATIQLSVNSDQDQLTTYLSNNGLKVSVKTLNLGVSSSLDTQLTNAAAAGTYDSSLQDAIKQQLNNYQGDLQQAFNVITGSKGRALLRSDYHQAQLLLDQLNTPAASPGS